MVMNNEDASLLDKLSDEWVSEAWKQAIDQFQRHEAGKSVHPSIYLARAIEHKLAHRFTAPEGGTSSGSDGTAAADVPNGYVLVPKHLPPEVVDAIASASYDLDDTAREIVRDDWACSLAIIAQHVMQPVTTSWSDEPFAEVARIACTQVERELRPALDVLRRSDETQSVKVDELIAAADAVVERWHSRDWKQPHTAEFIARLAAAVGAAKRAALAQQATTASASIGDDPEFHRLLANCEASNGGDDPRDPADTLRALIAYIDSRTPTARRDAASDAPAAEEVRMLSEMIHDGGLDCLTPYVSWAIEDGAATLDGQFSADELIAIGRYMQTEGGAAMSASQGKTEEAK